MHKTLIGEALLETVTFLSWAELHPEDVLSLGIDWVSRVFISPDVRSLHIVWDDGEGQYPYYHEIADYAEEGSMAEFLNWEIGDDSFEVIEDEGEAIEDVLLSDGYSHSRNIPVVRLSQLEAAYDRAKKVHELFTFIGLIGDKDAN